MVRVITQDTFNEAVKENIEVFSMTPEEALKDTIKQFEAQGVDLTHIVKDISIIEGKENYTIVKIISDIDILLKAKTASPELAEKFVQLTRECNTSLAHRILAAESGAYPVIISALEDYSTNIDIVSPALDSLISLMTGHPDLLDERGIKLMMYYLDEQFSSDVHQKVLKWARQCCLKHEKNRQDIFNHNIIDHIKKFVNVDSTDLPLIRATCSLMQSLVLDDDMRVEYGNAHEHARMMALEELCALTDLLQKFKSDVETTSELMLTLTSLVVRKEFCEKVEEAGGITVLTELFSMYPSNQKLIHRNLRLLKAMAGSDNVKDSIMKAGSAPLITNAMNKHRVSPCFTAAGCACIAALSLRSPTNSRVFCDAGAADVIIEGMKAHPANVNVQKAGSSAIRNLVCRAQDLAPRFLELGAEEVLNKALAKGDGQLEYEVKSALRDLGCKVHLKEQWTGKGGAL